MHLKVAAADAHSPTRELSNTRLVSILVPIPDIMHAPHNSRPAVSSIRREKKHHTARGGCMHALPRLLTSSYTRMMMIGPTCHSTVSIYFDCYDYEYEYSSSYSLSHAGGNFKDPSNQKERVNQSSGSLFGLVPATPYRFPYRY